MKNPVIDGIAVNAEHFLQFDQETAVKKMVADGFVPDGSEEWAARAYELAKDLNANPVKVGG